MGKVAREVGSDEGSKPSPPLNQAGCPALGKRGGSLDRASVHLSPQASVEFHRFACSLANERRTDVACPQQAAHRGDKGVWVRITFDSYVDGEKVRLFQPLAWQYA